MDVAIYYIMFLISAIVAFGIRPYYDKITKYFFFSLLASIFIFIIGLRYKIGGDWSPYLSYYKFCSSLSLEKFFKVLFSYDPLYVALNFLAGKTGGGIYFVNTAAALIFMYGYTKFALKQKIPSIAFLIGIPYLVIVVSMGYTRQSMAIGFAFLTYISLMEGRLLKASVLSFFAVLSHKTAIILYLIILIVFLFSKELSIKKKVFSTVLAFALIGVSLYFFLPSYNYFFRGYIESMMQSKGGFVRILMNFIPAFLYVVFSNKTKDLTYEKTLWRVISLICIVSLPILFLGCSTAIDRLNLYFAPIQMAIYSKFISIIKGKSLKYILVMVIVSGYFLVLYTWLNYAIYREWWVPYKNIFLE